MGKILKKLIIIDFKFKWKKLLLVNLVMYIKIIINPPIIERNKMKGIQLQYNKFILKVIRIIIIIKIIINFNGWNLLSLDGRIIIMVIKKLMINGINIIKLKIIDLNIIVILIENLILDKIV